MIKKQHCIALMVLLLSVIITSCSTRSTADDILPSVPDGAQALSMTGEVLKETTPYEGVHESYQEAKENYEKNSDDPDKIIWYGRWTAYKGDFRGAVKIYSRGISQYPDEPRLYRHRGHRYISIRAFERAVDDFEKAASLIKGKADRVEPDGQPNEQNIPVSTLHTNIWYHLGLAHYLRNDLEKAVAAYRKGIAASTNDDMLVATTHWLYMSLKRLGRDEEAETSLEPISEEMNVIENTAYHRLCLLYKGLLSREAVTGEEDSAIMNDATAYGVANRLLEQGKKEEAGKMAEKILEGPVWASFGYIAAEADVARGMYTAGKL